MTNSVIVSGMNNTGWVETISSKIDSSLVGVANISNLTDKKVCNEQCHINAFFHKTLLDDPTKESSINLADKIIFYFKSPQSVLAKYAMENGEAPSVAAVSDLLANWKIEAEAIWEIYLKYPDQIFVVNLEEMGANPVELWFELLEIDTSETTFNNQNDGNEADQEIMLSELNYHLYCQKFIELIKGNSSVWNLHEDLVAISCIVNKANKGLMQGAQNGIDATIELLREVKQTFVKDKSQHLATAEQITALDQKVQELEQVCKVGESDLSDALDANLGLQSEFAQLKSELNDKEALLESKEAESSLLLIQVQELQEELTGQKSETKNALNETQKIKLTLEENLRKEKTLSSQLKHERELLKLQCEQLQEELEETHENLQSTCDKSEYRLGKINDLESSLSEVEKQLNSLKEEIRGLRLENSELVKNTGVIEENEELIKTNSKLLEENCELEEEIEQLQLGLEKVYVNSNVMEVSLVSGNDYRTKLCQ
ncbi:MAG: hypothetical protein Alis3KO_25860 [Aliiglaciecola sp.]